MRDTLRIAIRKFDPFEAAIREEWESYRAESGCALRLETESLDLQPLHQALFGKGGLREGGWDVGFVVTDWLAEAVQDGALLDLGPFLAADPPEDYPQGWAPSLLRFQQFEGQTLGLPYHDGPECLIYRKDLFGEAGEGRRFLQEFGRPLAPPRTWEEFEETARFFTRPERGLWGTVFAAFPDGHNTVYDFCLQLWTRGGELFDAQGRPALDSPQAIEALAWYRRIVRDPACAHPDARALDSVRAGLRFAAGEAAMMVNWFGFAAMAETAADSKIRGKTAITSIPSGATGKSASLNVYWLLGIGSGSPHAEAAYGFLRHCAGRAADRRLTLGGGIGCRKSTWSDPDVNRTIPFYNQLESLHAHAREFPRLPEFSNLAAGIDAMVAAALDTTRSTQDICREIQKNVSFSCRRGH